MGKSVALRLGLVGASGRMGRRLLDLVQPMADVQVAVALRHRTPLSLPQGSTVVETDDVEQVASAADVVVDFSAPAAIDSVLPVCVRQGRPYLLASTGLAEAQERVLQAAAARVPVLVAANLSVGVSVLAALVQQACARLPEFDVEIVEAHHRHKRDAPSGTALALYEAAKKARAALVPEVGRSGAEALRKTDEVGLHAVRGGDVAGEHQVSLFGDGERLELVHRSHDGFVFARGAVRAARWLARRQAGLYTMADVLAAE